MGEVPCDHCEAEMIGETQEWDENDMFYTREVCLCPECGEDFLFPLAA